MNPTIGCYAQRAVTPILLSSTRRVWDDRVVTKIPTPGTTATNARSLGSAWSELYAIR